MKSTPETKEKDYVRRKSRSARRERRTAKTSKTSRKKEGKKRRTTQKHAPERLQVSNTLLAIYKEEEGGGKSQTVFSSLAASTSSKNNSEEKKREKATHQSKISRSQRARKQKEGAQEVTGRWGNERENIGLNSN